MPLQIDQNQCVDCGACLVNCPNRAIIRRGSKVIITDMCCDCGTCVRFCALGAISKGIVKAQLDHRKLDAALKDKEPEWIVKEGEDFYKSIGFNALPDSFYEKSSMYPLPADAAYLAPRPFSLASRWPRLRYRSARAI